MFNLCCVVGCDSRRKDVKLFCFPKDEKRLEVWLQLIKCETLRSLSVEELRKRFVCEKHFEKRFFASTALRARLRANAIPTLFSQSEICSGIPQTIIRTETGHMRSINLEHNYFKRRHEDHTYANMSKRAKTSSGNPSETGRQELSLSPQPSTQMDQFVPCPSSTVSAAVIEMDNDSGPMLICSSKENLSTNYASDAACGGAVPVPSSQPTSAVGEALPFTGEAGNPRTNDAILTEDVLILGDVPSQQKLNGKDIRPDLAILLQHIATSGLAEGTRKELLEKYVLPANCPLIDAPALNPELKAAIPEAIYERDKAIEQRQKQLSCVVSCLAETITALMTEIKDPKLIHCLIDASKLLCDAQHSDSLTRRNVVLDNIQKELKDQLQGTKIDELLFSEELSDAL